MSLREQMHPISVKQNVFTALKTHLRILHLKTYKNYTGYNDMYKKKIPILVLVRRYLRCIYYH